MERVGRRHVYVAAKVFAKVKLQSDEVDEAPTFLKLHKEVDVTLRRRAPARHGPEHAGAHDTPAPQHGADSILEIVNRGACKHIGI